MGERVKITKTVVDKLMPGEIQWDTGCAGFHVRRQKGEARVPQRHSFRPINVS
jgi:hypothetical protein